MTGVQTCGLPICDIIDRGYEGYCTVELVTMYMNEPRLYARQALERFRALLPEDER